MDIKPIQIKVPIWNGSKWGYPGQTCVGIALDKLSDDGWIYVDIMYERTDGSRLYPNTFKTLAEIARTGPTKTIKGKTITIVPLAKFHEISQVPQAGFNESF